MHIAIAASASNDSRCHHPPNTILTKCSKMTEEKHNKRHGMNGNADGAFIQDDPQTTTTTTTNTTHNTTHYNNQGGRLKFFKDGKFILELERAREGERVSWVSVPRKTFWPPQGTAASTPTYRQESSTSLSVSDDNSSIQSSPWQRDHSWKQTSPRRNQSKEMSFYFWHPKCRRLLYKRSGKRRRPYSTNSEEELMKSKVVVNSKNTTNERRTILNKNNNSVCNNNEVNNSTSFNKFNNSNNKSNNSSSKSRRSSLLTIIQTLIDNNKNMIIGSVGGGTTSVHPPPPPTQRAEMVVSPRKRFLREMEKDKVFVEDNCLKRSRNKPQQQSVIKNSECKRINSPVRINGGATAITVGSTISTSSGTSTSTSGTNSTEEVKQQQQQRNCSYSITSLLAEDRNIRRSPNSSPSHYNSVTPTHPPQPPSQASYCSSSSEDRLYSESVDRLRSIELSQADKRAYQAYPPPHPSYLPFMYPYSLSPYFNPSMYGRGYLVPPVYHAAPVSMAIRQHDSDAPSCSWNSTQEPQTTTATDTEHIEENNTDMPLNLSKHAG